MTTLALGLIPPLILGMSWEEITKKDEAPWDPDRYSSARTANGAAAAAEHGGAAEAAGGARGDASDRGLRLQSPQTRSLLDGLNTESASDKPLRPDGAQPFFRTGQMPGCNLLAYDNARENNLVDRSRSYPWDTEPEGQPISALNCNETTCGANVVTESLYQRSFENDRIAYTGKYVNTMTGEEYDTFEDDPPPATGDYQNLSSARTLERLQGSSEESHVNVERKEVNFQDLELPEKRFFMGPGQAYDQREELMNIANRDISMNMNSFLPDGASSGAWSRAEGSKGYVGFVNMMRIEPHMQMTMRGTQDGNTDYMGTSGPAYGEEANMARPRLQPEANKMLSSRVAPPENRNGSAGPIMSEQTAATKQHPSDLAGRSGNAEGVSAASNPGSLTRESIAPTDLMARTGGANAEAQAGNPLYDVDDCCPDNKGLFTGRQGPAMGESSTASGFGFTDNFKTQQTDLLARLGGAGGAEQAGVEQQQDKTKRNTTDTFTRTGGANGPSEAHAVEQLANRMKQQMTDTIARVGGASSGVDSGIVQQTLDQFKQQMTDTIMRVGTAQGLDPGMIAQLVSKFKTQATDGWGRAGGAVGVIEKSQIDQAIDNIKQQVTDTIARMGGSSGTEQGVAQGSITNTIINPTDAGARVGVAGGEINREVIPDVGDPTKMASTDAHNHMPGAEGNDPGFREAIPKDPTTDDKTISSYISQPQMDGAQSREMAYTEAMRTYQSTKDTAPMQMPSFSFDMASQRVDIAVTSKRDGDDDDEMPVSRDAAYSDALRMQQRLQGSGATSAVQGFQF